LNPYTLESIHTYRLAEVVAFVETDETDDGGGIAEEACFEELFVAHRELGLPAPPPSSVSVWR